MQSSGGGGFGDPAGRDPAALADDVADGYITSEGRAAYENAAPSIQAHATPGLGARHCRLPQGLADQLGAGPGHLVELAAAAGPARRLWVESVDPALPDGTVAAAFGGTFRIRYLGGARP